MSISHCYEGEGAGFGVCAAVGREDGTTALIDAHYRPQDDRSELQYMVSLSMPVRG